MKFMTLLGKDVAARQGCGTCRILCRQITAEEKLGYQPRAQPNLAYFLKDRWKVPEYHDILCVVVFNYERTLVSEFVLNDDLYSPTRNKVGVYVTISLVRENVRYLSSPSFTYLLFDLL
jgi:hypothetical protein